MGRHVAHQPQTWQLLSLGLCAALLANCSESPRSTAVPTEPRSNMSVQSGPYVTDGTPRVHMTVAKIMSALAGEGRRTDGNLIIGLKESAATRGVGTDGRELPVTARLAAETELRRAFPNLAITKGVQFVRQLAGAQGNPLRTDTIYRTAVLVHAASYSSSLIAALRAHPNVDYVAPNYVDGMLATEYKPWGVDTVEASLLWDAPPNLTGGNVSLGFVDTGGDLYYNGVGTHPDLAFNTSWYNYTASHFDNPCTSTTQVCYWENPYHGTGVIGTAMGVRNGTNGMGASIIAYPATQAGANIRKVFYINSSGQNVLNEFDFGDAILDIGYNNHPELGAPVPIGVSSVVYCDTTQANYTYLHDKVTVSTNTYGVLWFFAAGNHGGGNCPQQEVVIPARFPEAVAVGALDQVSGHLTLASYSAIDSRVDIVAPGTNMRIPWNRADADGGGYGYTKNESGTSFAAPLAAGVARLVYQASPGLTPAQLKQRLISTARNVGTGLGYGGGMVDAVCAVNQISPCTPAAIVSISGQFPRRPGNYTYTANASGGTGSYSYHWYISYDDITFYDAGVTTQQYTTYVGYNDNYWIRVVVTSGARQSSADRLIIGPCDPNNGC